MTLKLAEPGNWNCGVSILHGFTGPITEDDIRKFLNKSAVLAILNPSQRTEYHDQLIACGFRVISVFPNWVHNGHLLSLYLYESLPERSVENPRFDRERYPGVLTNLVGLYKYPSAPAEEGNKHVKDIK